MEATEHEVTIKHGDQEINTTAGEIKEAADRISENAHKQLRLIDGIALDKLRTELLAGEITEEGIDTDTDIPRFRERRYFVVSARAEKVLVRHKETSDDEYDIKIVGFKPEDIDEIDQLSYERCVRDRRDAS